MSLNWSVSTVKDWEQIAGPKAPADAIAVTDTLIWATMIVGIHSITEANAEKFYSRVNFIEHARGAYLIRDRKQRYIEPADVLRRIGLNTNASTLSDAQFLRKVYDMHLSDARRNWNSDKGNP